MKETRNKKLYVNDTELVYEIILSHGKGFLTHRAEDMLLKIARNFMYNLKYYEPQIWWDCYQTGIEIMLKNWNNFNPKKYMKALPYFTELMKRGATIGLNEQMNRKRGNRLDVISINSFRY